MGYYILGIIIFLLLIVFVSDLIRNSRNRDDDNSDIYYDHYTNHFYSNEFGEDFSDDKLEKELAEEEGKTNDMGVEPIHQNLEHQAFEAKINEEDKKLEDVLPHDPDANDQRR